VRLVIIRPPVAWCAVLLVLCAAWAPEPSYFPEPRYYAHDRFATQAKCEASRLYACQQIVIFCPDGRAQYSVSDIIHFSRYDISGGWVTVRPRTSSEVPDAVQFTLSADREILKHRASGTIWTRRPQEEGHYVRFACR
jgi:hypothetical protein